MTEADGCAARAVDLLEGAAIHVHSRSGCGLVGGCREAEAARAFDRTAGQTGVRLLVYVGANQVSNTRELITLAFVRHY